MNYSKNVHLYDGKKYNGIKNFKSKVKGLGSFYLIFKNAVNIEFKGFYGISHLIEHCMCEKIKELEEDFKRYGISYNALTGMTQVLFYIKGLDEGIQKFRKIFYDTIINYEITKDVFERERNIVIQEYNDSISSPHHTFIENVLRKYFCTTCPGGELEDLKNLTYEDFIKFKNCYFSYPTLICNTSSSKIKYKNNEFITVKRNYDPIDKTENAFQNKYSLKQIKGTISNISSIVGYFNKFKFDINDPKKFIYYIILSEYMGDGLTSPLYKELREETGHVYSISCNIDSLYEQGNGSLNIVINVGNEYVKDIKERLLKCIEYHFNNLNKNRFENTIIGIKNDIKKQKYLKYSFCNSFMENILNLIENFNFDFNEFKFLAIQLIKEEKNYILIDDKNI